MGVYYKDRKIGLGHTRLSIIELSHLGHQPMLSDDKLICLVFNGRFIIFVFRLELEKKASFKGGSDTEVVLNLYLEYGINCLSKLNGSLVWLSMTAEVTIFLPRDGLGVKPLYYFTNGKLSFSSEIKSLLS